MLTTWALVSAATEILSLGKLMHDPTCVRRGTRVWKAIPSVPAPSLPPSTGGSRGGVCAAMAASTADCCPSLNETPSPTLPAGEEGDMRAISTFVLCAIETLQPGDLVIAHDGRAHQIRRVVEKLCRGEIVCLGTRDGSLWLTPDHRVLAKPRPRTLGGHRDWSATPYDHLERRQNLRRDASPPERLLWSALRASQNGFKFRRQHSFGCYIVDFYCRAAHLVVEIDGETHYSARGRAYDRKRDAYLRGLGLCIMRIPATELGDNLDGVALAIQNQCRLQAESVDGARWVQAGNLLAGDLVFCLVASSAREDQSSSTPPLNPPVDGGRRRAASGGVVGFGTRSRDSRRWIARQSVRGDDRIRRDAGN